MKGTCWPRLSRQLTGPRHRNHCQSCGIPGHLDPPHPSVRHAEATRPTLEAWREHDGNDHPEPVAVVLCHACADRLIDPHPRLYSRIQSWEPFPGLMELCLDCGHRDGLTCRCPLLRTNGGDGMRIDYPGPAHVHVCRRGKGARSGWETWYTGPPTACAGRVPATPTAEVAP